MGESMEWVRDVRYSALRRVLYRLKINVRKRGSHAGPVAD
jgi:RNA 3'-terminal phosphate cyclase